MKFMLKKELKINEISISAKERTENVEESIDEIEIFSEQRAELVAEVIDDIYIMNKKLPALEEETIDEIVIAAKATWDELVVTEDSSFELPSKPVSELKVIEVDSFDFQALVRPNSMLNA